MIGESFFRGSRQNFTTGQSPEIWGNFPKICIKIIKNMEKYWENFRKTQIFIGKSSIFAQGGEKNKNYYIVHRGSAWFWGWAPPPPRIPEKSSNLKKFLNFLWIFNNLIFICNGTLMQHHKETNIFVESLGNSFKVWEVFHTFCCFAVANQRNLSVSNRNRLT